MLVLKKLLFAPLFLIFFYLALRFFNPYLGQSDFLLSLDPGIFINITLLSLFIFLSALFFVVFASLANNWIFVGIAVLLAAAISAAFPSQSIFIFVGLSLVVFLGIFISLSSNLKTYLTFKPSLVLGGSIKTAGKLLVLAAVVAYFFSIQGPIEKNGFKLPDSLLNTISQFAAPQPAQSNNQTTSNIPNLTSSQINLLKQNSGLLEQFGIDPSELNQIQNQVQSNPTVQSSVAGSEKDLMNTEIQAIISPLNPYIPYILAAMFLASLYSLVEIFFIFLSPILWLIFEILEEIHFVHFETEQREVKKLVV